MCIYFLFNFMYSSLPSPSSIRHERSTVLFRVKGSAKLRSDDPPSHADGRASRGIFPPHVTLRLGLLKTGRVIIILERKLYSNYSIILCHIYLKNRNQVGAGDQQFGQVSDPVLLFPLELILFLEQLGENLLLSGSGLCDWGNLWGDHPQVSGYKVLLGWDLQW